MHEFKCVSLKRKGSKVIISLRAPFLLKSHCLIFWYLDSLVKMYGGKGFGMAFCPDTQAIYDDYAAEAAQIESEFTVGQRLLFDGVMKDIGGPATGDVDGNWPQLELLHEVIKTERFEGDNAHKLRYTARNGYDRNLRILTMKDDLVTLYGPDVTASVMSALREAYKRDGKKNIHTNGLTHVGMRAGFSKELFLYSKLERAFNDEIQKQDEVWIKDNFKVIVAVVRYFEKIARLEKVSPRIEPKPPVQLLFLADPFSRKLPDSAYLEEYEAAQAAGIPCSLISYESIDEGGVFRPFPALLPDLPVVYRGWMLSFDKYKRLYQLIIGSKRVLLTDPGRYLECHHLPRWYHSVSDLTPDTLILKEGDDFKEALSDKPWAQYFVKDYVKSLTTGRGSVAKNADEVREIVNLIKEYRDEIEGGVCIREFEDFVPATEERYFVYQGRAYGRDGLVPDIVREVACRIPVPFYSVDIVMNSAGKHRLVELGDGQVSDLKHWPINTFINIFKATTA